MNLALMSPWGARTRGRSRGRCGSTRAPLNWGNNLTMIGAIRCDQWLTMSTMFQSANKERFVTWVRRRLLPRLRYGDVLILDNAPAHKDPRLVPLLRSRGVALRYLPPYSPDFNPIESAWALVKKGIRACAPRTEVPCNGSLITPADASRRRTA